MNLRSYLKRLEQLTVDNSPTILTGLATFGVVTTAYLSGKAAVKAEYILMNDGVPETTRERLELTWKCYIPPVAAGVVTVGAIIGAQHINNRRAAAMATAFTIAERGYEQYREKVIDRLGEDKELEVRDEVAKERLKENPLSDTTVIVGKGGTHLCYDAFSGRYFESSMETIKQAELTVGYQILHDGYASVSDLYYELGIPPTAISEEVGWNTDSPLRIVYSAILAEDDRPCIAIDYDLHPRRS